jgi:surface antigen
MRIAHWPARLVGAAVAAIMLTTVGVGPARAESAPQPATICEGFDGCSSAGRSSYGYSLTFKSSFWTMTAGHNCTNYAAYRLTHGRVTVRPPGTGSAFSWGGAARAYGVPVDDVPSPGAIAWWDANVYPAGSAGHVAHVESVSADGSVLISEDNLTGDFRWRRIVRTSPGWPSGFIHYPESDGSPQGVFESLASPAAGQIDFWGTSSDPDADGAEHDYLVSLGGPRGTAGTESYQFTTSYFHFHRIASVLTRGSTTMYLYALNSPGTAGDDVLLGRRSVVVRSVSAVRTSFVDSSISRRRHPRIRVSLSPSRATGTVDIMRGSTLLRRTTLSSPGTYTLTLPRQKAGRHKITVRYRGSLRYYKSSRSVYLRVR